MAVSKDDMRAMFASALSEMYRSEVPQYGTLLELVSDINSCDSSDPSDPTHRRMEVERHGAIRLGNPEELATMRRLFAIMGMQPVGYYDLTIAGLPVHATCFRPVTRESLAKNPFRVFTSLLRLDMIDDESLRVQAHRILHERQIFTSRCLELMEDMEHDDTYAQEKAEELLREALETFRWHQSTTVDKTTYEAFQAAHPLLADVVCFRGPHINHLTPRVADIEAAQIDMRRRGLNAKDRIEGPPSMKWPILLRQTSFLALEEEIAFSDGTQAGGKHRARFGEIEQRGMALTPKGRDLYDGLMERFHRCLEDTSSHAIATPESNDHKLRELFKEFPDDLATLRRKGLAYFHYHFVKTPVEAVQADDLEALIQAGAMQFEPITYEDFLPISAAGIFRSNLDSVCTKSKGASSDQAAFERGLGCAVQSSFEVYETMEKRSISECWRGLKLAT